MSWFLRGAQSAVFYYASCTPWHKYKHQRRRKQQNHADRLAREAYEKELKESRPYGPGEQEPEMLYRQPSPQGINEHWNAEIVMGPGPPPKRAGKKARQAKEIAESRKTLELELDPPSGPRPPDIVVDEDQADNVQSVKHSGKATPEPRSMPGSPRVGPLDDPIQHSNLSRKSSAKVSVEDPKWNHRRFYQREDEDLWGVDLIASANPTVSSVNLPRTRSSTNTNLPAPPPAAVSRPASSKSRPHAPSTASTASINTMRSQLSSHLNVRVVPYSGGSTESFYAAPRAPPINDDHPPVANNPLHSKKVLTKWMLQPTPAPSVMSGKKQVRRSTVGSMDSDASGSKPLSRAGSGKGSLRRERDPVLSSSAEGDSAGGSMRRQMSARLLAEKIKGQDHDPADEAENDADVEDD